MRSEIIYPNGAPAAGQAKEAYTAFCATAPDLPMFMQPHYLDAVCEGGVWGVVLAKKAERTAAAWTFFLKKKGPWRYIAMPPLGRMMGPYLLPEHRNARDETVLLEALLAQLPPGLAAFEQDWHYNAQNWLPLCWQGFRQTTRYSYTLDIRHLDTVWKNIKPDYRNHKIHKAQQQVQVSRGGSLAQFYEVQAMSFGRQDLTLPLSFDFLSRLDQALALHRQREIFFATDRHTGAIHSVAYLAWDAQSAYYLLAGDNPALRTSGAGILLIWEAVRYAHEVLQLPVFDFCGSMLRPIERVRRQFGAVQRPYFRVQKEWSLLWKIGKRIGN